MTERNVLSKKKMSSSSSIKPQRVVLKKKEKRKKKKGGVFNSVKNYASSLGKSALKTGQVGLAAVELGQKLLNPINQVKFAHKAIKGEGFVLPGSKYIGPGNRMDLGKPTSSADAAAYQHDKDYDAMIKKGIPKKKVYLGFSDADQRLMDRSDVTTSDGLATYLGMGGKKLLYKAGLTGKKTRDPKRR